MPAVTVVVPTCDRPALLAEALGSLLAQTFADWEAVVVDGSCARTGLPVEDPRFCYVHERDAGVFGLAMARDHAVRISDSPYVAYLDDDELYYPSKLEVMLNRLRRSPAGEFAWHDAVVSVVKWVDGRYRHACVPRVHWRPDGDPNEAIREVSFIAPLQVVHTRALYEAAGGFREDPLRGIYRGRYRDPGDRYDEDAGLFRRMAARARLEHVPLQLAEYRVHGGNVNSWGIDYQAVLAAGRLERDCY